jgi:hypothetical protein
MADQHFGDGKISVNRFIETYILPFVRFAERLKIIDGSLGRNYHDDYEQTLDYLLATVCRSCRWKERLEIEIHCGRRDNKPENVRDIVLDLARKHGLDGRVHVFFYGSPGQPFRFKHDRCLVSEMGVLNLGRGFDFVRKVDGQLRNTVVGMGGPDADTMLAPYAASRSQ